MCWKEGAKGERESTGALVGLQGRSGGLGDWSAGLITRSGGLLKCGVRVQQSEARVQVVGRPVR